MTTPKDTREAKKFTECQSLCGFFFAAITLDPLHAGQAAVSRIPSRHHNPAIPIARDDSRRFAGQDWNAQVDRVQFLAMNRRPFRPDKMTKVELDRLGAEAERVTFKNTRPLTREARRALARAANKGRRPRVGAGAKRVNVTIEETLLTKADAYARKHKMPRAAIVAEGLEKIVAG